MKKTLLLSLALSLFTSLYLLADVKLPAIIGSHMVLQQNSEVNIWGWCNPSEKVKLKADWDTTTYNAEGSSSARWSITIKTPSAGGPYKIRINGSNTIILDDVMIGEVWICSGQSNMEWSGDQGLKQSFEEAPNATNANIRFFYVSKATSEYPQEDCKGSWKVCTPEEMKHFSAIGYFFGKKLQQDLNFPVGLINANWGGTPAEVWTPKELVENNPVLKEAATKLSSDARWPVKPGYTYNAMIYPITGFNIAGALWYQGESNTGTWSTYEPLFATMIGAWRKAWRKDFSFYYVQIAPFSGYGEFPSGALVREAQTKTLSIPNTGMVVISDLVDNVKDIHPQNKKDVGLRLANLALSETYGKKGIAYKSPLYKNMKIEKDKIRIYFDNVSKGLISKNGEPTEFYIAGEDKKFVPAQAKIDGNMVIVSSKEIKNPKAVRFGFTNGAIPNLFSKEGLPVNLFRTDGD